MAAKNARSSWGLRAGFLGLCAAAGLAVAPFVMSQNPAQAEASRALAFPAVDDVTSGGLQTAIVSGGCFWGVQGVFQHVRGVTQAVSGYDGGSGASAIYEIVSTGVTGHAESVKITYDPKQISYGQILRIFFSVATDPTQVNEQYPDHGAQYRSEIWTTSPSQKHVAEAYIAQLNKAKAFAKPIATRVDPDKGFYRAEAHHQDYLTRNPDQPYIAMFDLPKIAALKKAFPDRYRAAPILTRAATS